MLRIEDTLGKARHTGFRCMTQYDAWSSNFNNIRLLQWTDQIYKKNLSWSGKMQIQTQKGVRKHR